MRKQASVGVGAAICVCAAAAIACQISFYVPSSRPEQGIFAELLKTKLTMPVLSIAGEKVSAAALNADLKLVAANVAFVALNNREHWATEERPTGLNLTETSETMDAVARPIVETLAVRAQDMAVWRLWRALLRIASKLADPRRSRTSRNDEEISAPGRGLIARCTASSSTAWVD
jgi:hypothetical protein